MIMRQMLTKASNVFFFISNFLSLLDVTVKLEISIQTEQLACNSVLVIRPSLPIRSIHMLLLIKRIDVFCRTEKKFFFRVRLGGAVCLSRLRPGCSGVWSFCVVRRFFWENVLGSFSGFYIEIVYSNFTFCGTYTLSFLACQAVSVKQAHPRTACGMSLTLHSQNLVVFPQRFIF